MTKNMDSGELSCFLSKIRLGFNYNTYAEEAEEAENKR
jgi:hypothetical protein